MSLKRAQNGFPRASSSLAPLYEQNQAFSIGFKGKTTNPSPRTESASEWRIEQLRSCQHRVWRVVLGSLTKQSRDISVHACWQPFLLHGGLAHTLIYACYVYRSCSHPAIANLKGPRSHITIIRCLHLLILRLLPTLYYSHSLFSFIIL